MASNPYVNKVEYGGQTLIDISGTTAVESDVASGKTFFKADGSSATGTSSAIVPSGNINITTMNSTNVTNYATAKVVDSDLVASNIKNGINILGVVGTYSGTTPSGTITLTANGTYNVSTYASATVAIPTYNGGIS